MKTKDLVVDQSSQRKVVEQVSEGFPHICIPVFSQTFIVETINLSDLAGLVIASKDGNAPGVSNFQCNKQCYCFHRVVASINVIP